ncbi:MAG: hypothetical protein ACOX6H_02400 [Christensenellales bacterium]|jgi:hypothetical protein
MTSKMRLWINITAIILSFVLIMFGFGAVLTKTVPMFTEPTIRNTVKDLSMDLNVEINNQKKYTFRAENGEIVDAVYNINEEETTFSATRSQIVISLKFENISTKALAIEISGIHFDEQERFTTVAQDHQGIARQIEKVGNKGTLSFVLEGKLSTNASFEEGSKQEVNLVYTHVKQNLNIYGLASDRQTLVVTISLAEQNN